MSVQGSCSGFSGEKKNNPKSLLGLEQQQCIDVCAFVVKKLRALHCNMLTVSLTCKTKRKQLAPRGSFRCQKLAKNSFLRLMYLEKVVQRLIGSAQLLARSNKDHYTTYKKKKSLNVRQIDIQRLYRNDLNFMVSRYGTRTAVSPHATVSRLNL